MTPPVQHSLPDLARLGGVTPRTIRYYMAQGLLPAPLGAGPGAHYGGGHLDRLRLIRRLQRQHLPLAEIRDRLAGLDDAAVAELVETQDAARPADGTALDYIRRVLTEGSAEAPDHPVSQALRTPAPPGLEARFAAPPMAVAPMAAATDDTAPPSESGLERSQWERLSLGPNIELHVRRPLGRHEQRRVERLITIARQVLKEETP